MKLSCSLSSAIVAILLTLGVEQSQRIIFQNVSDNPIKIWTSLEVAHVQRHPGTRFNAHNYFFSIRKKESELLQTLIVRIDDAMSKMQNLHPANFNLKQLDEELACMIMIQALPEEYTNFTSSILLLGTLSKSALQDTFYMEETNCQCHAIDLLNASAEMPYSKK